VSSTWRRWGTGAVSGSYSATLRPGETDPIPARHS
jgi:hypothetical protein